MTNNLNFVDKTTSLKSQLRNTCTIISVTGGITYDTAKAVRQNSNVKLRIYASVTFLEVLHKRSPNLSRCFELNEILNTKN